ncbi:MAG: hypothetical protein U1G07_21205 [Verrucomicrobiota bacterium]
MDANIWGFLVVGVGVMLCFGPALVVWLRAERKDRAAHKGAASH